MPRPDLTLLPWDDKTLDEMALEPSEKDKQEGKAAWKRDARPEARPLLDATEEEDS